MHISEVLKSKGDSVVTVSPDTTAILPTCESPVKHRPRRVTERAFCEMIAQGLWVVSLVRR